MTKWVAIAVIMAFGGSWIEAITVFLILAYVEQRVKESND